jgi:hypothetical protein
MDQSLKILSSKRSLKFFNDVLSEEDLINVLSDLKHRLFPRPFERLYKDREKKDLIGIEIGVAGGEHSLSLIKTLDIKKLYCIDPYSLYDAYEEGKNHFGVDQAPIDETEKHAHLLLSEYQEKIVWIKKLSSQALVDIDEPVDFVYIDGNHAENFVEEDIELYFSILKNGGVLGGHDFYNGFQKEHDGVVSAVSKFSVKNGIPLKVELPDWWLVKP